MRVADWPEILSSEIERARSTSFVWGKTDCCMFAADVVKAITGYDYAIEFRGRYKTLAGAMKALEGKSLESVMDSKLARVTYPSRGDVVLIPKEITQQALPALGVCLGVQSAYMMDDGLAFVPTSVNIAAWSIDHGR